MKLNASKLLINTVLGLAVLCTGVTGFLALSNRGLPERSQVVERLPELEKARLQEATHLRQALGDRVWPGWGDVDIPFIVYNEEYAFLVGLPDPADGWVKVPQNQPRGGEWEVVPGDNFAGELYFRQRLPDPEITPENFTVLVGDRWVATLQTKEFSLVSFVQGFRSELPPLFRAVFPYRWVWGQLMGEAENYIGALLHEAFHAFQGAAAAQRLAEAEHAALLEGSYPWDDPELEDAWKEELDILAAAVRSGSSEEAREMARQYLAQRDSRRDSAGLAPELVDYERQREWLEGLAKYAELQIGLAAHASQDYEPVAGLRSDREFSQYETRERFWQRQLNEVNKLANRSGETRFYYGGMAQAALLDRLAPGWKESAFEPGVMLEDLLRQAVR